MSNYLTAKEKLMKKIRLFLIVMLCAVLCSTACLSNENVQTKTEAREKTEKKEKKSKKEKKKENKSDKDICRGRNGGADSVLRIFGQKYHRPSC